MGRNSTDSPILRMMDLANDKKREFVGYLNLSRSTIYNMMNRKAKGYDPTFPKPIQLGPSAIGWYRTDIDAWQASRPKRHNGTPVMVAGYSGEKKGDEIKQAESKSVAEFAETPARSKARPKKTDADRKDVNSSDDQIGAAGKHLADLDASNVSQTSDASAANKEGTSASNSKAKSKTSAVLDRMVENAVLSGQHLSKLLAGDKRPNDLRKVGKRMVKLITPK